MSEDDLSWLEVWFLNQTSGNWQHEFGIKIETIDNPGWHVAIDLVDTPLNNKVFISVKADLSNADWMTCCVQEGKFEAFCGPMNLVQVLKVFRSWAQS